MSARPPRRLIASACGIDSEVRAATHCGSIDWIKEFRCVQREFGRTQSIPADGATHIEIEDVWPGVLLEVFYAVQRSLTGSTGVCTAYLEQGAVQEEREDQPCWISSMIHEPKGNRRHRDRLGILYVIRSTLMAFEFSNFIRVLAKRT